MAVARQIILSHLARAARSRRFRAAARQALATATLASVVVVVGLGLLGRFPGLRPWLLLALACVLGAGLGLCLGALVRRQRPGSTATWIGRAMPSLGFALADAVEFGGRLARGESIPTGSSDLAAAHVEQAAHLASQDDPARHARLAMPRLHAARAGLALVAVIVAAVFLPRGRSLLLHGSPPAALDVVTYGDVELRFRYPAYLRLPPRLEVGTGDIQAPVGTRVTLRLRADRKLASARLEAPGGLVDLVVDGDAATGNLVVTRDGAWRALLEGVSGAPDPSPPSHLIRAQVDQPPEITIRRPVDDTIELSAGDALMIDWTASDDHGLAEIVAVHREASDEAPPAGAPEGERDSLVILDTPTTSRSGTRSFTTAQLGLAPGKRVDLWLEARDDDEVSGPKWAASRHLRITMGSRDEQGVEDEERTNELAEQLLATLAGHLVSAPDAVKGLPALIAADAEFSAGIARALTALSEVLGPMQERRDDLVAATALEQMRGRLEWTLRARAQRVEQAAGDEGALRASLASVHPAESEELERDVLFFDMWADRRASMRAADAMQELLESVRRLQAVLARSPDVPDSAAPASAEIARLADALAPTMAELVASATDPTKGADAKQALAALREAARRLQGAIAKRDTPGARETASQMESVAQSLSDLVDDLAREGSMGDPELGREIEQAHGELRRLSRQQADLRDETNKVREDARASMSAEDRKRLDAMFDELLALADAAVAAEAQGEKVLAVTPTVEGFFQRVEDRARLEARIAELDDRAHAGEATTDELAERDKLRGRRRQLLGAEPDQAADVESLMRLSQAARESLGRLRQVLAERQLDDAHAPARWALGALQLLLEDIGHGSDWERGKPPFQTAAARTSEILSRLDDLERQVERALSSQLTTGQRQQMERLARSQSDLVDQARRLGSKLRELGADAPFLDEQVARSVDQAGEQMDEATGRLHERKPGEASEQQGEALARLDEATKAMSPKQGGEKPADKPGGKRRGRSGQGEEGREDRFGRYSREQVDIPDADDYRVPKEFREEILEAMREGAPPQGYEEQVREYYRRLVE